MTPCRRRCCFPVRCARRCHITSCTSSFGRGDHNASQSWLVVVGAHHFGADNNDPLFQAVQGVAWAGVLLVEADPHIARQMADRVAVHSPVPLARTVRIANLGVCPPKHLGGTASIPQVGQHFRSCLLGDTNRLVSAWTCREASSGSVWQPIARKGVEPQPPRATCSHTEHTSGMHAAN